MTPPPTAPGAAVDDGLARRLLDALDHPAGWPAAAAAASASGVRWRCPTRRLDVQGRDAVLARRAIDAEALGEVRPVTLRRAVTGTMLIHESSASLAMPVALADGTGIAAGTRVELHCTRILTLTTAGIVDELVLENWTPLPPRDDSAPTPAPPA